MKKGDFIMKKLLGVLLALAMCHMVHSSAVAEQPTVDTVVTDVYAYFGDLLLKVTPEEFRATGFEKGDLVRVSLLGYSYDAPVVQWDPYEKEYGCVAVLLDDEVTVGSDYFSDLTENGLLKPVLDGNEYKWVWDEGVETPVPVTITLLEKNAYAEKPDYKVGVLSLLSISEEDFLYHMHQQYLASCFLYHSGAVSKPLRKAEYVTFCDTLDALTMELMAGEINAAQLNQATAEYLATQNDMFEILYAASPDREQWDAKTDYIMSGLFMDDYAFMLLEEKVKLRDEMTDVIGKMKEDGTLQQLIDEYIGNRDAWNDPRPVEFETFEGAETIRVGVSGDVPPMDYIRADGTPVGFSTAVMSEVGKRLHRNIELVQVSNVARSLALAQDLVDVVFWTRTRDTVSSALATGNGTSHTVELPAAFDSADALERKIVDDTISSFMLQDMINYSTGDTPAGVIVTDFYYSDPIVTVVLK